MTAQLLDRWLGELGLDVVERGEREGVVSRDVMLDGRRRHDIRVTIILDPAVALVCWVHYAPPINDSFRVSYRKLLRWNDELPFVKFAVAPDERPVLTCELAPEGLDMDALGSALARLVAVCDLLVDDSRPWLWPGAKVTPALTRPGRTDALLERYAADVSEIVSVTALGASDPAHLDAAPSPIAGSPSGTD